MSNLHDVLSDQNFIQYITDYEEYRQKERDGILGKTAQLWVSYMDHVHLILSLVEAVKDNDKCMFISLM